MKTLAVTLADFEGVPHGSTLAHTKVKVEARYSSDLTLADGRIIPAAVKVKELPSTGERTFEVWASDDPAVAASSRGFAVIVTATITPTRGGGGARVQRTVKPLMSMDDVIHLGTLSPAEPVPPQWSTVDDMLADVEASRAAAQGAKTAAEAAVEAVGPAAQAAAAPAVTAAQSAKSSAASSATSAANAVTLAQQAQKAALEVPDNNVSALIRNPATQTTAALNTRLPSRQISVTAMPSWTGNPADDQTAAFIEAAASFTGAAQVLIPAGTWKVQGAPLREGLHYVGEGSGPTGTKLILPSPAAGTPMLVSTQSESIWSGGVHDIWMLGDGGDRGAGATAGADGINLFSVHQTMGFYIVNCRIESFDIGIRGAQHGDVNDVGDDRWLVVQNSLIWKNKIGLYGNEHPQIFASDFRQNDVALTGRLFDFNLVGKNKFIRNRVGICPDTLHGRGGVGSTFINGAIFFRNSTAMILGSNTMVTGCLIEGGEWNPATQASINGASVGIEVTGLWTNIVGNYFNPAPNVEHASSIKITNTVGDPRYLQIAGNVFKHGTNGKAAITVQGVQRGVKVSGNTFTLTSGSRGIDVIGASTESQLWEWTITDNKVTVEQDSQFLKSGATLYATVARNDVWVKVGPGSSPIIDPGSGGQSPCVYESNVCKSPAGVSRPFMSLDGRYATIRNNAPATNNPITLHTAADANATLSGNGLFKTEARGTVQMSAGVGSVVVTHGLTAPGTVTWVMLSAIEGPGSPSVWVTGRTSTQFTINRSATAGAQIVAWHAMVYP